MAMDVEVVLPLIAFGASDVACLGEAEVGPALTENLAEGGAMVISDNSVLGDLSATALEASSGALPASVACLGMWSVDACCASIYLYVHV